MNITYLSQARLPSAAANSVHVTKMCSALADIENHVTLIGYSESGNGNIYQYYNTPENYEVKTFNIDQKPGESIWLALKSFLWNFRHNRQSIDLIYSRSAICLFTHLSLRRPFVYEVHSIPRTGFHRFLEKRIISSNSLQKMVFISNELKTWYLTNFPQLKKAQCLLLPDASDEFEPPEKTALLPGQSNINIGYIGHLYPGKGGEKIVAIAKELPQIDFHIVGGLEKDIQRLKALTSTSNVFYHGHIPYRSTKSYLAAFDIVLAPYERKVNLAQTNVDIGQWMSPLKIFEYMSAGKPIISSKLPVLEEILTHENNALLAAPENTNDWVRCINQLTKDAELAEKLGKQAKSDFTNQYTWKKRAENIVKAVSI